MSETEDKLARELGLRLFLRDDIWCIEGEFDGERNDFVATSGEITLWRKCLELTEQRGVTAGSAREFAMAIPATDPLYICLIRLIEHGALKNTCEFAEAYASSRLAEVSAQLELAKGLLQESWSTLSDVCEYHGDCGYILDVESVRELMKRIYAALNDTPRLVEQEAIMNQSEMNQAVESAMQRYRDRKSEVEALTAWNNIPKHYQAARWAYEYDEVNRTFFVHSDGHRIADAEDSEVAHAICQAYNGSRKS